MPIRQASPIAVLGVPVDNVTMEDVLGRVQDWIQEGGFHQIATANTDFLINSLKDEELGEILRRCHLVMADGMPLVWTSRLLGNPLKGRVTGSDLVPRLIELSARCNYRIFLLGGTEASLDGTMAWIKAHHPGAKIAGRYSPAHASLDAMDHDEILTRIRAAAPDILLVAFGNPKQEKWLSMHRHRLEVPVCVGIGASFDFLAGAVLRAPQWMQRSGLEWCYRLAQEPKRLVRRYTRNACGLLRHVPAQLATYAVQPRQPLLPQLSVRDADRVCILTITGDFAGPVVARFEEESTRALSNGLHIALDLSQSSFIGPDALGLLIRVTDIAKLLKRELWLTGMRPFVSRAVRCARPGSSLRIAPGIAEALRRMEPSDLQPAMARYHSSGTLFPARIVPFANDLLREEPRPAQTHALAV